MKQVQKKPSTFTKQCLITIQRNTMQTTQGKVEKADSMHLHVYRRLIIIYVILVLIQLSICVLDIIMSELHANVSNDDFGVYQIITRGTTVVIPNTQMALVAFLYTKNTLSKKAFEQGCKLAVPFSIVWFVAEMLSLDRKIKRTTPSWIHIIIDVVFLLFCLSIVIRQCQHGWLRRNIVLWYIFIVVIIVASDLTNSVLNLEQIQGACIAKCGYYAWTLIYPFAFFFTVKNDSHFWTDMRKPFIEKTRKNIQDFILFDESEFPQNAQIHYDREEDHRKRFEKLQQIVSGYVPLIPFKKIKWDGIDISIDSGLSGLSTSVDYNYEPQSESRKRTRTFSRKTVSSSGSDNRIKLGGGSTGAVYCGRYGKQIVAIKEFTGVGNKKKKDRRDKHKNSHNNNNNNNTNTNATSGNSKSTKNGKTGPDNRDMNWTDLTLIFRESILNSSLSHPNIVKFIGASLTPKAFYLIYEHCEYGDLQKIVVDNGYPANKPLSCTKQRLWYLIDVCNGLIHLHKNNFVHRDLKTANVVVTWNKKIKRFVGKICDFGVSRSISNKQKEIIENNYRALQWDSSQSQFGSRFGSKYDSSKFESKNDTKNDSDDDLDLDGDDFDAPFETKEIERTLHVGTPAFLAPEILFKLVRSKGIILKPKKRKM